jgi:hypothetical protein
VLSRHADERTQYAGGRGFDVDGFGRPSQVPVERRARHMFDLSRVLEHRAHQPVDGREGRLVLEPEVEGDDRLLLEHDPVARASGLEVQGAANPLEELVRGVDGSPLGRADQRRVLERLPDGGLEPPEQLDVAEPSGALLQIRFQERGDGAVTIGARVRVRAQVFRETTGIGPNVLEHPPPGVVPHPFVSGDRAAVEHRRSNVEAFGREGLGRFGRSNTVPDLQSRVPQRVQEGLGELGYLVGTVALVGDQQVDVGVRREASTAVAAERDEGDPRGRRGRLEERSQTPIHELDAPARGPTAVMTARVGALEGAELLEQPSDGRRTFGGVGHRLRVRRDPSRRCGSAPPARRASPRSSRRRSCPCARPS